MSVFHSKVGQNMSKTLPIQIINCKSYNKYKKFIKLWINTNLNNQRNLPWCVLESKIISIGKRC